MDRSYEIAYFLIETFIYFLFNFGILFVVFTSARASCFRFIVNLAVASIFSLILHLFLGLDYYAITDFRGPWLCGVQAFTKSVLKGVIPLTIFGVSFERVRSLPRIHSVECFLPIWKVVFITWGVSGFLSLPKFFAYEYFPSNQEYAGDNNAHLNYTSSCGRLSHCQKTPLLGRLWVKVFYESLLFCLLHLAPALYSIYALHKIRFKLSYICLNKELKHSLGTRLYRKLKHIRLAFLYTIVFTLVWIPFGIITVWRSLTENPNATVVNIHFGSPKRNMQKGLQKVFMTAHPILYLYTHHHSGFTSFFKLLCKCRWRKEHVNDNDNEMMAVSTIPMETFEASLLSE